MPLAEAAYDPASERLIKALVDARILLSSGSEQNATIRLAHQRVLENWRRAKEIVAANAEFFRIRDDVEALRRRWDKSDKKRDLLIPKGVPLAEAESIAKRYPDELGAPALGFIAASGKRARLRQRLVGATALVMAVLAVGATVAGIRAWRAEQTARRNFDIAKALVTDIAKGLRDVEGMRAEARTKIFDQVSSTLDTAVAESPNDQQLLGMQATMFREFASTHEAEGDQPQAAKSTAKSLEIELQILEMAGGTQRQQEVSSTLERIGELKLGAGDDAGALITYEKILDNRRQHAEADPAIPTISAKWRWRLPPSAISSCARVTRPARLQPTSNASSSGSAWPSRTSRTWWGCAMLAQSVSSIGYAKFRAGDYAGALESYQQGLGLARQLADADKTNPGAQRDLALVLANIGDTKLDSGDNAGALDAYQQSLAIRRTLAAAEPAIPT